jgi:hypothetical protein
MKVHTVYDFGPDASLDRYTVYFKGRGSIDGKFRMCLAMSGAPFHPQGFCQHVYGMVGKHNGKKIRFEDLPESCQRAVQMSLEQ